MKLAELITGDKHREVIKVGSDSTIDEAVNTIASNRIGAVLVEGDSQLRDIKPQAELPYLNLLPWIIADEYKINWWEGEFSKLTIRRDLVLRMILTSVAPSQ